MGSLTRGTPFGEMQLQRDSHYWLGGMLRRMRRRVMARRPSWVRNRLAASTRTFSASARNPGSSAFAATWTAEPAFTVAIGVVAFRDGGAAAVGLVAFVRTAPSALLAPVRDGVRGPLPTLPGASCGPAVRAGATGAAAAVLAAGGPKATVDAIARDLHGRFSL